MSKIKYCQCKLVRKIANGDSIITSYIPQKYAKIGKTIKLRDDMVNVWTEGWVVESVGEPVDEDMVPDYRKGIREHRKRTGDSLRKE